MGTEWLYYFLISIGKGENIRVEEYSILLDMNDIDSDNLEYYREEECKQYLIKNIFVHIVDITELETVKILKCQEIDGVFVNLIELNKKRKVVG